MDTTSKQPSPKRPRVSVEEEGEMHRAVSNNTSDSDVDLQPELSDADMAALMSCEKELKSNPNLYDTHIRYLELLQSAKLKQKLQNAREAFSLRFPLNEKLWVEWLDDVTDPTEHKALLERAVKDYLSLSLWKRYLGILSEELSLADHERILEWRRVSESALGISGMHFSQGHEIWDVIIETEKALLRNVDGEAAEEQTELIRYRYFTAMGYPLLRLDAIRSSYASWERDRGSLSTEPPPYIANLKTSVNAAIEARTQFETALNTEDLTELLTAYVAYCTMEERHGILEQVMCIYERALAAFPVTHTLWLSYGSYVERKGQYEQMDALYERAARNCPWLGRLWESRIRAGALYNRPIDQIQVIYDRALKAGLRGEEDYMSVILSWLDFLRCDYWKKKTKGEAVSFEMMHAAFTHGYGLMRGYFPKYLDRHHRLPRYWADALISIAGDVDQARGIWESVLEVKAAAECVETWMYYIQMETGEKHHGPARRLYHRAFRSIVHKDAKYTMALEWLRHEGRNDICIVKSSPLTTVSLYA